MPETLPESELIKGIENRSVAALALWYDRYSPLLYKIIWVSVKDGEMACLLLEKTMCSICCEIKAYDPKKKSFALWMAGIAKRTALGYTAQQAVAAIEPISLIPDSTRIALI